MLHTGRHTTWKHCFSVVYQAGRGGGAQRPGPIEMKLCMTHYNHKSIPGTKFEHASSSSVGDMKITKFPSEEGNESPNSAIYPMKKGLAF